MREQVRGVAAGGVAGVSVLKPQIVGSKGLPKLQAKGIGKMVAHGEVGLASEIVDGWAPILMGGGFGEGAG